MTITAAGYINYHLEMLEKYIIEIENYITGYNEAVSKMNIDGILDKIDKTQRATNYEKDVQSSYKKALDLYWELTFIAEKYKSNTDVNSSIRDFHQRLKMTRLPIYGEVKLRIINTNQNSKSQSGVPTGAATEVSEETMTGNETNKD